MKCGCPLGGILRPAKRRRTPDNPNPVINLDSGDGAQELAITNQVVPLQWELATLENIVFVSCSLLLKSILNPFLSIIVEVTLCGIGQPPYKGQLLYSAWAIIQL